MRAEPLGDQAIMTTWDSEAAAFGFAERLRAEPAAWQLDVVQAYHTVAVFLDPGVVDYFQAVRALETLASSADETRVPTGRRHVIPCCYELGLDLERVAQQLGRTVDEVSAAHIGTRYTVYAIGFCPGFPYLGYLPEILAGVPRLATPRLRVEAGSVGLTGRQTGIYTEVRPGGWPIIGRTPLCLVDVADGYFPLRTGDEVEFRRIDAAEFERRRGERL